MTSIRPCLLSLFCLVCLASAARAENQTAPIRDDAGMFHAAAIQSAEQRIADIHMTFDRNVFVRTVGSAPPRRWFPFLRTPKVNRMLEEQAQNYADESGSAGIYVVICKRPLDVHVVVRPEDDATFSRRDAEMLRRTLAWRLHEKGADAALASLVDQLHDVLQEHQERGPPVVDNNVVLGGVIGGGVGLWLLLRLIRFRMRAGGRAGSRQRPEEVPARATPALLGAAFGCPAGLWIYDKLYPFYSPASSSLCEPPIEPAPKVNVPQA
jgi:hypothetical protein